MRRIRTRGAQVGATVADGLARSEFTLVYQPQVALSTDRIVAAEALVRWSRPQGLVPPGDFIPAAEESGDIVALGAWILGEACRQAATWKRDLPELRPWHVSVNVSPRQFREGLGDEVRSALQESGLEPADLCLEVTETALIDDVDFAASVLDDLCDIGVTLSMDDFGTGYSSLSSFSRLPLDEVKIDQAFVSGLGRRPGDTAIVAAVLSMAHALERTVVAEGVETPEQLDHLRRIGCDAVQGFLLARPMPPEQLMPFLSRAAEGWQLSPAGFPQPARPHVHRVLVVDDAPDIRRLAAVALTTAGFQTEEAGTGEGGVALATALVPDCVLLDMNLPDTDGLAVCAALRADPALAGCTIVMLTGSDEGPVKAAAFSAGADEYIVKPFSPRDLVGRVQAAIRRRALGSSAPSFTS
jgi:EAL domain-containing protein (putative c-di-GMP-specific phosphodiesterase class I)/CheY-like chemotaxis protein